MLDVDRSGGAAFGLCCQTVEGGLGGTHTDNWADEQQSVQIPKLSIAFRLLLPRAQFEMQVTHWPPTPHLAVGT